MWADRRAVSQPTPSVCLWANAVLKWAHYHQREHKHSSRKQDSLCQEREPLPPAHRRPDEITRLKIRQGSYYYCRHAPRADPAAEEDNPHSCSHIPFHLSFWLQLVLSSSIQCLLQAAGGSRCIFVRAYPQIPSFLWWNHHGFSVKFPGAIVPRRDRHYSHIEIPEMRNVGLLSITVLFECIVFMCHDLKKHLASVPVILVRGCVIYFFLSSFPQNFFQIISNLLEEENKEKWEDAQKVSTLLCT